MEDSTEGNPKVREIFLRWSKSRRVGGFLGQNAGAFMSAQEKDQVTAFRFILMPFCAWRKAPTYRDFDHLRKISRICTLFHRVFGFPLACSVALGAGHIVYRNGSSPYDTCCERQRIRNQTYARHWERAAPTLASRRSTRSQRWHRTGPCAPNVDTACDPCAPNTRPHRARALGFARFRWNVSRETFRKRRRTRQLAGSFAHRTLGKRGCAPRASHARRTHAACTRVPRGRTPADRHRLAAPPENPAKRPARPAHAHVCACVPRIPLARFTCGRTPPAHAHARPARVCAHQRAGSYAISLVTAFAYATGSSSGMPSTKSAWL